MNWRLLLELSVLKYRRNCFLCSELVQNSVFVVKLLCWNGDWIVFFVFDRNSVSCWLSVFIVHCFMIDLNFWLLVEQIFRFFLKRNFGSAFLKFAHLIGSHFTDLLVSHSFFRLVSTCLVAAKHCSLLKLDFFDFNPFQNFMLAS